MNSQDIESALDAAKKLKKPQLYEAYKKLLEKQKTELEIIKQENDTLKSKSEDVLRAVASWENSKQIILQDAQKRLGEQDLEMRKSIADLCIFLYELAQNVELNLKTLLTDKISNLESKYYLSLIKTEQFDPELHVPLSKQQHGTLIKTYVTKGYTYENKPLILAKVLLN